MSFKALVLRKKNEEVSSQVEILEDSELPDGDVTVKVEYSTLNYKDGLCLGSGGGLVKNYPHVAGIDFSGVVENSNHDRYKVGDRVVLTGWRVGEIWWGGYAQKARVKGDWLVPLPETLTTQQAMVLGTAGFTSMLAINALEKQNLQKNSPVLVTGAAGGVGSISIAILSQLGYEVAAVTGRPETSDYLKGLGASQIVPREEINQTIKRPLESETWAGCIDSVGGEMLARILGQLKYSGTIASVGLAGGTQVPASIIPFLLRANNILGIDSVLQPYENRIKAWNRMAEIVPVEKLEKMTIPATLSDLPQLGRDILSGKVKGRVVVDVNQ